ncbi:small, acid-soluble spore protein, alpha/beta type [Aneurinibacillus uraniidurans]
MAPQARNALDQMEYEIAAELYTVKSLPNQREAYLLGLFNLLAVPF